MKPPIDKITELINKEPIVQQKIILAQVTSLIIENIEADKKRLEEEANGHKDFIQKINGN